MSGVTRRSLLVGAGTTLAVLAIDASTTRAKPKLVIFDSRIPESVRFARQAAVRQFDIAREDSEFWRRSRSGLGLLPGDLVVGMTGWTDWVTLRGLLGEQGKRVRRETRIDGPSARTLFAWAIA